MTVQTAATAVLAVASAGKLVEFVRDGSPARRLSGLLAWGLILLTLGTGLSLAPVQLLVDRALGLGVARIAFNAAQIGGLYALLVFFSAALHEPRAARTRARADGVVLAVVACLLVIAFALAPAAYLGEPFARPATDNLAMIAFHTVGGLYAVYAYGACGWWAWRLAARTTGASAVVVMLLGLGLTGLTVTSIVRVIWIGVRAVLGFPLVALDIVDSIVYQGSSIVLVLGLVALSLYRLGASAWRWCVRRRRCRQLHPLWAVLRATFPEASERPRSPVFVRVSSEMRWRVVECRDGLARLGPGIALAAGDRDVREASPAELAGYIGQAVALRASAIGTTATRTATRAPGAGPEGHGSAPVRLAVPADPGIDGEAEILAEIAREFARYLRVSTGDGRPAAASRRSPRAPGGAGRAARP